MATNPTSVFKDGDTKVINGATYVRQGGVWSLQGGSGGLDIVVPKAPTPKTPTETALDEQRLVNERLGETKTQLEINDKDPAKKAQTGAAALLKAAGVDLASGRDPVTDLIKGSTSGYLEHGAAEVYGGVTGRATPGMENIAKLQTLASNMTLGLMNGSLGTGISNADRDFIVQQVGDIANANVPANQRLAAWEQVKQRMANITGVDYKPATNLGMGFADEEAPDPVNPLNPEQQAAYDAFLKANPKPSAQQIEGFFNSMGMSSPNAADVAAALEKGGSTSGAMTRYPEPDISSVRGEGGAMETADAAMRSAANVIPFNEEIAAAANTIFGDGTYRENLNWERAVDEYDWKNHPIAVVAGTVGGAMLIPTRAKAAAQAARSEALAGGATEAVAHQAAKSAFVKQLAKEGAAYGAAAGAGSEGNLGERATAAVTGGVVGAATGAAGGKVFGPGKPARAGEGPSPMDIARALEEEGIPAARPIADPTKRGKMSILETTQAGHSVVRDSLEETRAGIADKVSGLKGPGDVKTPGGMGEVIQKAGTRRLDAQKRLARRSYDKAADLGADVPVNPTEALTTLDAHIARLSRNPNANRGTLSYLKSVRGDLADAKGPKAKSVADIRDIRTGLNDEINRRNLGRTRAEAIMEDVLAAARRDISRDLGKANPEALRLYGEGDDMWRAMSQDRTQVVENLIGRADNPLSGDKAMAKVRAMMGNKGDMKRFQRTLNMMTPKQREDFAATLFEGIGQKSPEEPLSPATFLSNTRDMQPEALEAVFGREGRRAIMNLRVASRGFTDAQGALNNSRSGFVIARQISSMVVNFRSTVGGIIGFHLGGPIGGAIGAAAGMAAKETGNLLSAKALMNTDVSQWIRAVSKVKTDKEARGLIAKLGTLASRNPQISQELTGLRSFLLNAANDNFGRAGSAVASPDERPNQQ